LNGSRQATSGGAAILYSFRRCPYAIRARLALAAAGLQPGLDLELREVALQAKPPELLAISAKGTVPVLVLRDAAGTQGTPTLDTATQGQGRGSAATVLDESLAIMRWALGQRDPEGWVAGWSPTEEAGMDALIAENDGPFKHHLDHFKYAGRYGREGLAEQQDHRERGLAILRDWNRRLQPGGWLLGDRRSLADIALLPFVRQFRLADPAGFDAEPDLAPLQTWLQRFLASKALLAVMQPPWAHRAPWRSPGWLYHLALSEEWQEAQAAGVYSRSTRGRSLEEVGFLHASHAHQIAGTYARFYADLPVGAVRLLTLDPARLAAAGLAVIEEPAPGSGELFPHLYGALPLEAVLRDEPWPP
jgi:glutathione S-transferase